MDKEKRNRSEASNDSKRSLTELQVKFLEALFGEAQGDLGKAKKLAGYSDTTALKDVTEGLQDEIISLSRAYLGAHAPKAVFKLTEQLDIATPNANTLKTISMILDKAGLIDKTASDEVNLKVPSGGLFILPAKEARKDYTNENNEV